MSFSVYIRDSVTKIAAHVNQFGELAVGSLNFDKPSNQEMAVDDQVYNFIEPKTGHCIVITGITLYANKGVGAADATVIIYESTGGADSATQTQVIHSQEMLKQTTVTLNPLNLLVAPGRWVNGTTDDNTVFATIFYHYIKDITVNS